MTRVEQLVGVREPCRGHRLAGRDRFDEHARDSLLARAVRQQHDVGLPYPRQDRRRVAVGVVEFDEVDVARTPVGAGGSSPLLELGGLRRLCERLEPLPAAVPAAFWWLERHAPPPPRRTVLVHGDYRMGNLVVDGDRITGVLDWEMAAPGDPIADVTWCFIPVWELPGVDEQALVRRYAERSGSPVEPERLHWHRVLGFVRLAYYALAGTRAFDAGRSDDLRLAALRLQLPVTLDRLAATLAREPVS